MDVFIKSLLHFADIMTRNIMHACRVVLGQKEEGLLLKVLLFFLLLQTCFKGHTDMKYEALKEKEAIKKIKT